MLKLILFTLSSSAFFLMVPAFSTAADYYYGMPHGNSLVVDFGNDGIEADARTITAIHSKGATTLTLKTMRKECTTYCQEVGIEGVEPVTSCHYEGIYPAFWEPTHSSQDAIVFRGKRNISNVIAVKPRDKAPAAFDLLNQWESIGLQGVISVYSHQGFIFQPRTGTGRWQWKADAEEFIFEVNGDARPLPRHQLKHCRTITGTSKNFESLNCNWTREGYGYTYGWLYLDRSFFFEYGCDDCDVPELMISASFLLDKSPHYIVTDSTGRWGGWIVQKTESGGVGLSFGGTDRVSCH